MPNLQGKVALITGASRGIGEATALHFASLGCCLALTARDDGNLKRVAEACCKEGLPLEKVLVVPGDVTVGSDVADVVEKTLKHFGKIDILVNNAGIVVRGTVETASMEDFNRVWTTNFCGPLCMMKNAIPFLRQTKGAVVNISSVASRVTASFLQKENAPYGVRVNVICPAYIKTTILMEPGVSEEEHMERLEKEVGPAHALGRIGTPEEVARCVAFLASEDAAFITGATVTVDGGLPLLSSISGAAERSWLKSRT